MRRKAQRSDLSQCEEDRPAKIIKVSEAEPEVTIGPLPMDPSLKISPVIRVTPRAEVRELDPKLMSHLGYMNRNRRPLSSKVKEELSKVDLTKKSSKFHEAKKRHSN